MYYSWGGLSGLGQRGREREIEPRAPRVLVTSSAPPAGAAARPAPAPAPATTAPARVTATAATAPIPAPAARNSGPARTAAATAPGSQWLGPGETLAECPEPSDPKERDALIAAVNQEFAGHVAWAKNHLAEGHPDLLALIDDYWQRVDDLKNRPRLIRCKAEARRQAAAAVAEWKALFRDPGPVKRRGATVIAQGFTFKSQAFPGMRAYYIRGPYPFAGGVKPPAVAPEQAPPPMQVLPAGDAAAGPAPAPPPTGAPIPTVGGLAPTSPTAVWETLTQGAPLEVGGVAVPREYLTYALLGLLALMILRK